MLKCGLSLMQHPAQDAQLQGTVCARGCSMQHAGSLRAAHWSGVPLHSASAGVHVHLHVVFFSVNTVTSQVEAFLDLAIAG